MKTVMIRQPGYMPNLNFFKKIQSCDVFVYLDNVQFSKDSFDNRNRIKTQNGVEWITVPLQRPVFGKKLNQVSITYDSDWIKAHSNLIFENYESAPYFPSYWYEIEKIINKKFTLLIDLNYHLINYFLKILKISTQTVKSSDFLISKTKTERLVEICSQLNATCYISGVGGKNYIDESLFKKSNIKLMYENFSHPKYNQLYGDFIKNMSIIDLLLNEGPNSSKILSE